jgi:hypothetical protein
MFFTINQISPFMKKIVLIISMMIAFAGFSFAQTTTPAAPKKKDGTADMRYKANKDAAKKAPVHAKKDGTADKRFKENKTTPPPKKS